MIEYGANLSIHLRRNVLIEKKWWSGEGLYYHEEEELIRLTTLLNSEEGPLFDPQTPDGFRRVIKLMEYQPYPNCYWTMNGNGNKALHGMKDYTGMWTPIHMFNSIGNDIPKRTEHGYQLYPPVPVGDRIKLENVMVKQSMHDMQWYWVYDIRHFK